MYLATGVAACVAIYILSLTFGSGTALGNDPEERPPTKEGTVADIKPGTDTATTIDRMRQFWTRDEVPRPEPRPIMPFRVPPRKEQLQYYPCMDCHEDEEINILEEHTLTEEHETLKLEHGGERFWCPTCHNLNDMNHLRSMKDKPIDFDESYLVCGQCHFERQSDWFRGGHGKRIGNWNGEKIILVCVECHNPHSPSIKPKKPDAAPVRERPPWRGEAASSDLVRQQNTRPMKIWEQLQLKMGFRTE
ncbi:MAG: hypothetical protein HY342_04180 [Candidatus Lambdaproteobacteria bacterium]|nr:hypothetical protein [Candidatus Lambdaproteobacteria bacterium]